jgi:hypothetical protein
LTSSVETVVFNALVRSDALEQSSAVDVAAVIRAQAQSLIERPGADVPRCIEALRQIADDVLRDVAEAMENETGGAFGPVRVSTAGRGDGRTSDGGLRSRSNRRGARVSAG